MRNFFYFLIAIISKVTFWYILFAIGICLYNFFGYDDKDSVFFIFGLEPILYKAVYTEPFRSFIFDNGNISWFGYLFRVFTFIFYGLIIDVIIYFIKRES